MKLGKLKEIKLREIWKHEQYNFSSWLAKEENIVDAISNYEQFVHYSEDKNLINNIQNKINNLKKKLPIEAKQENKEVSVLE